MTAYYNEIDPYAAQWLRNLIKAGHIAPGDVDERSILDVSADDLKYYTQCHFFAGIGVWSHALKQSGWSDDRPVWTGSCPCQPFSVAGKGDGQSDERHLWPVWFRLIGQCRPPVVFGEQVEAAIRHGWLDLVQGDLEGIGYASGAVCIPASSVGAPHIRKRLWFVAHSASGGRQHEPSERPARVFGASVGNPITKSESSGYSASTGGLADTNSQRRTGQHSLLREGQKHLLETAGGGATCSVCGWETTESLAKFGCPRCDRGGRMESTSPTDHFWRDADWLLCRDGKWRPVEALPQPLADGSAESLGRVCAEVVTEIEEEINASAMEAEIRRPETLRALLNTLGEEAKRGWSTGGIPRLHEAPFLLAFVRQLKAQGWDIEKGGALHGSQIKGGDVRVLRGDKEAASTSHKRGLDGQPFRESSDTVHFLSSLLACHTQKAWAHNYETYAEIGFPIGHGSPSRVGRLRAYGNAIVPQVAQEVIQAFMEFKEFNDFRN